MCDCYLELVIKIHRARERERGRERERKRGGVSEREKERDEDGKMGNTYISFNPMLKKKIFCQNLKKNVFGFFDSLYIFFITFLLLWYNGFYKYLINNKKLDYALEG